MPLTGEDTRTQPALTARSLLVWGLLAGLVGGLLAFGFAAAFGEPAVDRAIAIEESAGGHDHGAGADHGDHGAEEPEVFGRTFQSTVGLGLGSLVYGLGLGGIFGLAFAFAYGRVGPLTPRATALALAAAGYVAVVLVPFLTYPGNPPAVGDPATIGRRTALYFGMVAISVALAVAAVVAGRALSARLDGWTAAALAVVGYVVVVTAVAKLLPGFREVPEGFPGDLLWEFRVASLGTSAVLWAGIGLAFAVLLHRGLRRSTT